MVAPLPRLPDWRARFSSFVIETAPRPFEWGVHDCVLFAADGVLAQTEVDLAEPVRGRYSTARGALKVLRRHGYADLPRLLEDCLPEISPRDASCGDVVMIQDVDGPTCGLRLDTTIVAVSLTGHRNFPIDRVTRAFKVGV